MKTFKLKQNGDFPYDDFIFDLSEMIDTSFHPVMQKDARVLGELIETALDLSFQDLTKVEGNQAYDLIDSSENHKIEVRVIGPNSKVTFAPSSKAARIKAKEDKSIIFKKANEVTDWVFVESRFFPFVRVYHLKGTDVLKWLQNNTNKSNSYPQSTIEKIKQLYV